MPSIGHDPTEIPENDDDLFSPTSSSRDVVPDDDTDLLDTSDADEDLLDTDSSERGEDVVGTDGSSNANPLPGDDEDLFDAIEEDPDADVEAGTEPSGSLESPGSSEPDSATETPAQDQASAPATAPESVRLPIFNPLHNVRECSKQLWLLEDHLNHPEKHCPDCIRKHLLAAEALADEAITLDKTGSLASVLVPLPGRIRGIASAYKGATKVDRYRVAQKARTLRKELSKLGFDAFVKESDSSATSGTPSVVASSPDPDRSSGDKPVQKEQKVSLAKAASLVREALGGVAGIEAVGVKDGKIVVKGSAVVVERLPSEALGYAIAKVAKVAAPPPRVKGSKVQGQGVESLTAGLILVPPGSVSDELRGRRIQKYDLTGRTLGAPFALSESQLAVADKIQQIFQRELAGICQSQQPATDPCIGKLIRGAIVNAIYESNLNPMIVSQTEPSVGLWQLNSNGAGAGMSIADRQDIEKATRRILEEFNRRRNAPIFLDALRKDRENGTASVGDYARAWAIEVERPASASIAGAMRARTADLLFSGPLTMERLNFWRGPQREPIPPRLSQQIDLLETFSWPIFAAGALLAGLVGIVAARRIG